MEDVEDDEEILYISGSGEGLMEEGSGARGGSRRDEDIALDLMKFIAMTTGYGRTTSSGVGFQGTGSASKPEEYATHLLGLYGKCGAAVGGKRGSKRIAGAVSARARRCLRGSKPNVTDSVCGLQADQHLVGYGSSSAALDREVSADEPVQDFVVLQGIRAVDDLCVSNPADWA